MNGITERTVPNHMREQIVVLVCRITIIMIGGRTDPDIAYSGAIELMQSD
jgi:hypothetical protein